MAASPGRPKSAKQSEVDALATSLEALVGRIDAIEVQVSAGASAAGIPAPTAGVIGEDDLYGRMLLAVVSAAGMSALGKKNLADTTENVAWTCRSYYHALGLWERGDAAYDRFMGAANDLRNITSRKREPRPARDPRAGFESWQKDHEPQKTQAPTFSEDEAHRPAAEYFGSDKAEAVKAE